MSYCFVGVTVISGRSCGKNLFKRFGLAFYTAYISLSVSEQVNALLSGFSNMLHLESDGFDSVNLFLKALKLLMLESRYQNVITLE